MHWVNKKLPNATKSTKSVKHKIVDSILNSEGTLKQKSCLLFFVGKELLKALRILKTDTIKQTSTYHRSVLMLSTLGKIFSRQLTFWNIFLIFQKKIRCDNLQIVSGKYKKNKKNITNLSSAELVQRVVKIKIIVRLNSRPLASYS